MKPFKIIPAIDIMGGKCVRLTQGNYNRKKIYATNPTELAKQFISFGFDFIHVVDLDGARAGEPKNLATIENIAATGIAMELGGGLRKQDHLHSAINAGAKDLVLGTTLLRNEQEIMEWGQVFPHCLVAGIDVKNSNVAINGWEKTTKIPAITLVKKVESLGFSRLIYTDIQTDGMLAGPNLSQLKAIATQTSLPVVASGGVSSLNDIENIKSLSDLGVVGVIVGKAIYEQKITLQELSQC